MDQIELGKFINELRIEANLTQDELAEKIGVSSGKIVSKWENGYSMPDFMTLKKLSVILNVTLYELSICKRLKKKRLINRTKDFIKSSKDIVKLNLLGKFFITLAILIGLFFGICSIYTIDNYNTVQIYEFKSLDDNFTIKGNIIFTNDYNVLNLINISYINKEEKKYDIDVTNIEYQIVDNNNYRIVAYLNSNNTKKANLFENIKRIYFIQSLDNSIKTKISSKNDDLFYLNIKYKMDNMKIESITFPFKIVKKYQNNSL